VHASATYPDKKKFGNTTGMATGRLKRWKVQYSMHTKANVMVFWILYAFQ